MPTAGGPNTLGESNLVFAYDTGDVKNSYKGQPTVNAFGTYPIDLYGWITTGNACTLSRDTIQSPVGITPLKMVTTGNDAYTGTYGSSGWNIAAASSGQTWTISVWAKANQNTTGQIFHFGANSSGGIIDFSATTISLTTEWTRYTYTRTFTDGNVVAIQARLDGPDTFQSGVVIWWDGLQVEQKAYATQFVAGTRSATQGLLPVIGNSTIDLTNVSFDSNAQMTFDGTNDYVETNSNSLITGTNPFTIESITNKTAGSYGAILGNYGPGYNQLWWASAGLYLGGDLYHSDYSNTMAGWHYSAVTRDSSGNAKLYRDGILVNTATLTASVPTNVNWRIGANVNGAGEAFTGNIPIVKVYNNVLTADQIKQNYQQYKTRFNLS